MEVAGGEITIGRDTDRQMVLPSASVSRKHARLVLDGPQPYVMDEGSANGVIVNGVRIAGPTAVVPGVRVDIAEFHLEFEVPQANLPVAPPMTEAVAPISARMPPVDSGGGDVPIRLVAEGGPFDGRLYDIPGGEVAVGRAVDNDMVLDDPSLSRKHARVRRAPGGRIEVEDLGSSNGTFVNGRRVGKGAAGPGDSVRFGELSFRIEGPTAGGTRANQPSASNGWIVWVAVAVAIVAIGAGAAVFLLRKPSGSGTGTTTSGNSEELAAAKVKSGKEKLADKKFDAALADFVEAIRLDPINAAEARRLKSLAESEPQNEKTSKQVVAKAALGDRASFESAVRSFGQIPSESGFRAATGLKLSRSLVTFGEAQCKAKKWPDCAWAVCKAYDVAPADGKPGSDASATLKDAEKHLAKDKSYIPCKKH